MLGVEVANRESSTSWKDFLLGLKRRGLQGVIFVGSDDHPGLKRAIMEVLRKPTGSAATSISCVTHSIIYRAKAATIVSLNYDGFTAGATRRSRRDLAAWLLRWQENIQSSVRGLKKTSKKPDLLPATSGAPQTS